MYEKQLDVRKFLNVLLLIPAVLCSNLNKLLMVSILFLVLIK